MESKSWKEALDVYWAELTERLSSVIDGVVRKMKCHISHSEYQKITSNTDPTNKIEAFLNAISSRTSRDFDAFCEALVAVKQNDLAEKLSKLPSTVVYTYLATIVLCDTLVIII